MSDSQETHLSSTSDDSHGLNPFTEVSTLGGSDILGSSSAVTDNSSVSSGQTLPLYSLPSRFSEIHHLPPVMSWLPQHPDSETSEAGHNGEVSRQFTNCKDEITIIFEEPLTLASNYQLLQENCDVTILRKQLESEQASKAQLQNQVTKLQEENTKKATFITQLQAEVKAKAKTDNYGAKKKDAKDHAEKFKLVALKAREEQSKAQLAKLEMEHKEESLSKVGEFQRLEANYQHLREDFDDINGDLEKANRTISMLRDQLNAEQASKAHLQTQVAMLDAEIENKTTSTRQLQAKVKEFQMQSIEWNMEKKALKLESEKKQMENVELNKEIHRLMDQLNKSESSSKSLEDMLPANISKFELTAQEVKADVELHSEVVNEMSRPQATPAINQAPMNQLRKDEHAQDILSQVKMLPPDIRISSDAAFDKEEHLTALKKYDHLQHEFKKLSLKHDKLVHEFTRSEGARIKLLEQRRHKNSSASPRHFASVGQLAQLKEDISEMRKEQRQQVVALTSRIGQLERESSRTPPKVRLATIEDLVREGGEGMEQPSPPITLTEPPKRASKSPRMVLTTGMAFV